MEDRTLPPPEHQHPFRRLVAIGTIGVSAGLAALGASLALHEAGDYYARMNPNLAVTPSGISADGMVDRMDVASQAALAGSLLLFSFTGLSVVCAAESILRSRNS